MTSFLTFLTTTSGTVISISVCIILVLVLLIVLIIVLSKYGKKLSINFNKNGKNGSTEVSAITDEEDTNKSRKGKSVGKYISYRRDAIINDLKNHKFFSYVKYKYVNNDYDFTFENYELLISHGIKKESERAQRFKKAIASTFLSECVFKYFLDTTESWVNDVIAEYTSQDKTATAFQSFAIYNIIENLLRFTKETTRIASNVKITFEGTTISGIPVDFIKYFCKIVNSDMNNVQDIISSILYTSDTTWYIKINEILDMLELVMIYIKDSIDATLIILNGQIETYLNDLIGEEEKKD